MAKNEAAPRQAKLNQNETQNEIQNETKLYSTEAKSNQNRCQNLKTKNIKRQQKWGKHNVK